MSPNPASNPNQNGTEMGSRCVFLEMLDLSDEVIRGTTKGIETTPSFRRMPADQQWNPETVQVFVGVHGESDGCAACQGDSQVRVSGCRERVEDIFDREKQPGQPRAVVQPEELGRVAYHLTCLRKWNKNLKQQQRATIPEPIAIPPQPCSSSHEDPMQVNTTPRRARIPEDDDDTRTARQRLDMSALISELCERDVPEIDWEKLGETSSSVFDIYIGQVKAGRETAVKCMFEFRSVR